MMMKEKILEVFESCERCGTPIKYLAHRHSVNEVVNRGIYQHKGKQVCCDCKSYLQLGRRDDYRRKGNDFGIDCVSRIKVQIWHETFEQRSFNWHKKEHFTFTAYCDAERKTGKKEFQIRQDFDDYYWHTYVIPKNFFIKRMQGRLDLIKIPEKLILLTNEDFLDFLYDCMNKTQSSLCDQILYEYGI